MERLKQKISFEYKMFRKEIGRLEYAFWWVIRILMFIGAIKATIDEAEYLTMLMWSNLALLFVLPTLHILPRKWCFFANLSHHNQTVSVFMVLITAYIGNYFELYHKMDAYDFLVHFFSGIVCVFVGYDLARALAPKSREKFDTNISTIIGFGISCFAALFWEIYEFSFDIIMDENTQRYLDTPEPILISIFRPYVEQYPLFDTMSDIIAGLVGAVVGGFLFRIILVIAEKKKSKAVEFKTEKEAVTA